MYVSTRFSVHISLLCMLKCAGVHTSFYVCIHIENYTAFRVLVSMDCKAYMCHLQRHFFGSGSGSRPCLLLSWRCISQNDRPTTPENASNNTIIICWRTCSGGQACSCEICCSSNGRRSTSVRFWGDGVSGVERMYQLGFRSLVNIVLDIVCLTISKLLE